MTPSEKLLKIAKKLEKLSQKAPEKKFSKLKEVIRRFNKAWSGSWWGQESRVYYANIDPIPPGVRFGQESPILERFSDRPAADWRVYEFDSIREAVFREGGLDDWEALKKKGKEAVDQLEEFKAQALSVLSSFETSFEDDSFFVDQLERIKGVRCFSASDYVNTQKPSGSFYVRDIETFQEGMQVPPHLSVDAELFALDQPFLRGKELEKHLKRLARHLENLEEKEEVEERRGINVFIGHGRSAVWRDLKDFIQERLHLPYDEFNRVPAAGIANTTRLSQMLDKAAIAFLVMTAEDEQAGGEFHARMNVIHEAGLFQGRLGFDRAILLLEEGCKEFSNVQGLGQIRFPKGDIKAKFEEIREVLEREGLIEMKESDCAD